MSTITTSRLAESAAPLDALLVDAALGPVRRFVPDMSTAWVVPSSGVQRSRPRRSGGTPEPPLNAGRFSRRKRESIRYPDVRGGRMSRLSADNAVLALREGSPRRLSRH